MGQERPRCAQHDLATGPDGLCVVCRRESRASSATDPSTEAISSTPDAASASGLLQVAAGIVGSVLGLFAIFGLAYQIASGGDGAGLSNGRGLGGPPPPTAPIAGKPQDPLPPAREPARVDDAASLARARAGVRLELYSTGWCPHCDHARRYLRQRGYAFVEYDVDDDRSAAGRLARLNPGGGIPFLVADGTETVRGFGEEAYESAIDRAARARLR